MIHWPVVKISIKTNKGPITVEIRVVNQGVQLNQDLRQPCEESNSFGGVGAIFFLTLAKLFLIISEWLV